MTDGPTAIVTDVHLAPDSVDALLADFDGTVERILSHDPTDIVVLGDAVSGPTRSDDRRLLSRFLDRLEELPIPYRFVPGNHDVVNLDPTEFVDLVGNDRWAIDTASNRVYLDSSAPHLSGSRGEVGTDQLDALRGAVDELDDAVVFVHHPIHYRPVSDNYWFSKRPEEAFCGDKRFVREVLSPAADRIAAVVNGHLHAYHDDEVDLIPHFTIDTFNKRPEPTGETGAFALLWSGPETVLEHHSGDGTRRRVRLPG